MTRTEPALRRAYAYCRTSADVETGNDASIAWQLAEMRHYAKNQRIEVVDVFRDLASSGPNTDRPAFDRMIEQACADDRPVDLILTGSLSRFSRRLPTLTTAGQRLSKAGVQLFTVVEGKIDICEAELADAGGASGD